jgi:hypothetical protein
MSFPMKAPAVLWLICIFTCTEFLCFGGSLGLRRIWSAAIMMMHEAPREARPLLEVPP